MKKKYICLMLVALLIVLAAGCGIDETEGQPGQNNQGQEEPVEEPVLDAAALVETRCAECHSLDRVYREREKELWSEITTAMVGKSPELLNEDTLQLVVGFLQDNYSK